MQVKITLDEIGITDQQGNKLFRIINNALQEKCKVVLDFRDSIRFTAVFFNAAIGRLLSIYEYDFILNNVSYINCNPDIQLPIKLVVKNSHKYFTDDEYRKAVDLVMDKQARDMQE